MIQTRLKMMLWKKREDGWSDVLEQMKGNAVQCTSAWSAHLATGGRLSMWVEMLVGGSVLGGRESKDREGALRVWESGRGNQSFGRAGV